MTKGIITKEKLTNIADAIRTKTGSTSTMSLDDMVTNINSIEGGDDVSNYFYEDSNDIDLFSSTNLVSQALKKLPGYFKEILNSSTFSYGYIFANCFNLEDISCLKGTNYSIRSLNNIFYKCRKLTSEQLNNIKDFTLTVTNPQMIYTFYNCSKITNVDFLNDWNISGSIDLTGTFSGCSKLNDISALASKSISPSNMYDTFRYCSDLENADLSSWSPETNDFRYSFANCSRLKNVKLGNGEGTAPSSSTTFGYAFNGCLSLETVDLSGLSSDVINVSNIYYMFNSCVVLSFIDIRTLKCSNITSIAYYSNALNGVPKTCTIVVKDDTEKSWWKTKFPDWSSCFKTAEEYDASKGA